MAVVNQKKLLKFSYDKAVLYSFFLIQFLFVAIFSLTESIPQALTIKLALMVILLILSLLRSDFSKLNRIDFFVYLFLLYGIESILWGDFSNENILISAGYLINFFLTYSVIRFSGHVNISTQFFILIWILEILHIWILDAKVVGGGYIFGHTSIAIFLVSVYSKSTNIWRKIPYIISLGFLSGLRFFGLSILCFFPYLINVLLLLVGVPFLYVLSSTYLVPGSEYYSLGLGYRVSEIPILVEFLHSSNVNQLLFGEGVGMTSELRNLGSKGWIEHKNWFHNFFISIIFTFGLLGFCLISAPVFLLRRIDSRKVAILVAVYIMLCIDTHRDGAWILFMTLGLIGKDYERET